MQFLVYSTEFLITYPNLQLKHILVHLNDAKWSMKRNKAEQDDWLESDLIGTYDHMTSYIADHLTVNHPSMISKKCDDHILLYKLDNIEHKYHSPGIALAIRFFMDLSIRVFLCGERIPDSGMKWALSHTNGIVKHWS